MVGVLALGICGRGLCRRLPDVSSWLSAASDWSTPAVTRPQQAFREPGPGFRTHSRRPMGVSAQQPVEGAAHEHEPGRRRGGAGLADSSLRPAMRKLGGPAAVEELVVEHVAYRPAVTARRFLEVGSGQPVTTPVVVL